MQPDQASPTTIALWTGFCGEGAPASLIPVLTSLLQLYIYTTVSDPPMRFNAEEVASTLPFCAEDATSLDDKIKPGKPCMVLCPAHSSFSFSRLFSPSTHRRRSPSQVLCPALYSADGLLKAKAKVLALDYL